MRQLVNAGVTALTTVIVASAGVVSAHAGGVEDGPGSCVITNTGANAVNACRNVQSGNGDVVGGEQGTTAPGGGGGGGVGLPNPALPYFRVGTTNTTYKVTLSQMIGDFDPAPDPGSVLNGNGQLFWPTIGLTGAIYMITDSTGAFQGNVSLTFDVRNAQNIIWRCEASQGAPVSCASLSGGQLDTIKLS